MSEFNQIIFDKKTLADVFKDIYNNSRKTEKQITDLITSLGEKIDGPGSAALIVPLIVQYLDVKVKNDEHLVKMAAIIQRAVSNKQPGSSDLFLLTPEEEKNLLETAKELQNKNVVIEPTKLISNKGE